MMSFLVKRGIEKDNFYDRLLHESDTKQSKNPNVFSSKKEDLTLIKNVTGKVSKGFVVRTKDGRIVNTIDIQNDNDS